MVTRKSGQSGLSLIELMVAITLGLLLTAAVIQVFVSSRSVFRMQDSMARLQENGRFAIDFLARDIRMAGFMGCPSIDRVPVNIIASSVSDYDFSPDTIIVGQNDVAAANAWSAVEGTDVITIRKASDGSAPLTGNTAPNNTNIQVERIAGGLDLEGGEVLMITDCVSADVFQATNVSEGTNTITMAHASDGNIENKLSKSYGTDAEVLAFERIEYFIRDTGRRTTGNRPINALYVRRLATVQANGSLPATLSAYELVDAVEDLQVEYGLDSAGSDRMADEYRDASLVTDWSEVVSVRINLLMQGTEENVVGSGGAQAQTLTFMGDPVDQDGRLRQVFSTTIAIRNRVP